MSVVLPPLRRIVVEALVAAAALALLVGAWHADPFWLEIHSSGLRCVHDAHLQSLESVLRGVVGLGSVLLGLVVRPRLVRAFEQGRISFGAVARYGVAIVLALVVAQWIAGAPKQRGLAPSGYSPEHVPDAALTWRLRPASEHGWRQGGRDFVYAVNDEGNRASSIHENSDHARPTIVVGGESIALGMGNPYEDSFPALVEARSGVQVVDTAVDAYGLDQMLMREREVVPTYPHLVAVVTMFLDQVADRAETEDRSRLRVDGSGALVLTPPTPEWLRDLRIRRIFRGLYHSGAELDDLRAQVRAIATLARHHGAYPLFVTTSFQRPCLDVRGRKPYIFRSLIDDQGIPRANVDLTPGEHLSDDPHPGPEGQKRLADAVEAALRDANVL